MIVDAGKETPLDLVRVPVSESTQCRRFVLGLSVQLAERADVVGAFMRYDLWLVNREPDGREVTERLRLNGRQGASLQYTFAPLHHRRDGTFVEEPVSGGLETQIYGTLLGRVRRDGAIGLEVGSGRSDGDDGGSVGAGGFKRLIVRSGETVEVTLPPAGGTIGSTNLAGIFKGQATSIRITTTRVR